MALNTTSNTGSQSTTQSPQISNGSSTGAASGNVQPGIASGLLNSTSGIPLSAGPLPNVRLGTTSQASTGTPAPVLAAHHFNAALLSLPILLLIIAAGSVWATNRSVKSTTKYS